jgi:hypothetical protein
LNRTNRSHNPQREEDALVTDFLDEKRDEIDDRLAELRPLIEEYNRLLAAASALRGVDGSGDPSAVVRAPSPAPSQEGRAARDGNGDPSDEGQAESRDYSEDHGEGDGALESAAVSEAVSVPAPPIASAPPPSSPSPSSRASAPRRAGRPKGSGTRAAEALRIVRENPGVTIPELADRMGIKQNYLYRVLPELVQEGKVAKQGRGWHPRAA